MDIGKIDKNMQISTTLNEKNIEWHNVREEIFDIYGLYNPREEGPFKRLPRNIAEATSQGVLYLYRNTAGGRVRFCTDSNYIAIKCYSRYIRMWNMGFVGSSGFDLYIDGEGGSTYYGTFTIPIEFKDEYDAILYLPTGTKYVTINFPLYNDVNDLFIGVAEGSSIGHGKTYKYTTPVVYYGSSITQGGCASRPGNAYQHVITRMLDCDHINLGFSGGGKAEQAMCDYIADLDMSVFFMDYDHNAPNAEYLKNTHENLYLTVRKKHPDIPIIMTTKPDTARDPEVPKRRAIIYDTYSKALERGENVYFVDGGQAFGLEFRDSCTVDGCHPNDLGFIRMAQHFAPYVKAALESIK